MYIKKLILHNFQVHKKLELHFTDGVNIVIGETNAGKTAIIRALYLLIENAPRGGDIKFQKRNTKDKLKIEVFDNLGNHIIRSRKQYILNNIKLTAFNQSVPEPIIELLPFNLVNWQKQLDPHFLVLNTGSTAAKILAKATGMEGQEGIIKEIKERVSSNKNTLKRINDNLEECQYEIDKLQNIKTYLTRSEQILKRKRKKENEKEFLDHIEEELTYLFYLKKENKDIGDIQPKIKKCDILIKKTKQYLIEKKTKDYIFKNLQQIQQLQNKIKQTKTPTKTLKQINKTIKKIKTLQEVHSKFSNLESKINTIQKKKNKKLIKEKQIKKIQLNFNLQLKECGQCPLCGQSTKKRNTNDYH